MGDSEYETADLSSRGRVRNHAVWLGLLLSLGGLVSYFIVFARFPALRDFPWINLPLVLSGLGVAFVGLRRALARPRWGKVLGIAGFVASLLLAALFVAYVFWISYQLPAPAERTLALSTAPDFALTSAAGDTVHLSDFHGRRVVLVFYRGFW